MKPNSYLDELEGGTIYLIREAYYRYKGALAILWSMGKDSTTLLYLARKAFLGRVEIPVIHIDTSFKFRQIYDFRDKYARIWNLKKIIAKNETALSQGVCAEKGRFDCCNQLKTEALKVILRREGIRALLVGIRRDEHNIRAKERYFSPRNTDFTWDYQNQRLELWGQYFHTQAGSNEHFRIHPLLAWREIDVWRYIEREKIPVLRLYFAKHGVRYRSVGCSCCCQPISSKANSVAGIIREITDTSIAERSGRTQDKEKEYMMQKLRSLGYM
jgi:sulfate adenylyltransferase subunit 2